MAAEEKLLPVIFGSALNDIIKANFTHPRYHQPAMANSSYDVMGVNASGGLTTPMATEARQLGIGFRYNQASWVNFLIL